MAIKSINNGTGPNTGDGDPLRTIFTDINNNFSDTENAASKLVQDSPTDTTAGRVITTDTDISATFLLGDSITKDVQSSPSDTTSDRLLNTDTDLAATFSLGDSITKDVQTSPTDSTSDRVLLTGADSSVISGLGTAATKDVQTSPADTTSGRLLTTDTDVVAVGGLGTASLEDKSDLVVKISSVFDIAAFANLQEGDIAELVQYHPDSGVGGGSVAGRITRHNGGTAISKSRIRPTDWNDEAQLIAWFADSGVDELCAVRSGKASFSVYDYGAKRDGITDDSEADDAASAVPSFGEYDGIADIIIVYGQSNAVGFAGQPGAPAVDDYATPERKPGAYNYDAATDSIVEISNTMNHLNYVEEGTASRGNGWTAFANEWVSKKGRQCVILNAARGGKSIAQLSKGAGSGDTAYYQVMLDGYDLTLSAMQEAGLTVGNTYLVFHQGETDMTLGTTYETYKTYLQDFFEDIKTDIPEIQNIGIAIVGCPNSREQYDWARIQNSQYSSVDGVDKTSVIYKECPAFSLSSGQYNIADQTHYSQRGYNQMGKGMARGLIDWIDSGITADSPEKLKHDLSINGTGYGGMQLACATADISAGSASLLRRENTTDTDSYYPSYINLILTDAVDDDCVVFRFSGAAPVMYSYNVELSEELTQVGIYAVASKYNSGDVYGLKVKFFADLTFLANVSTGALLAKVPPASSGIINSVISSVAASGVATLTHPELASLPTATYYSSTNMEKEAVSLRSDSSTQTRVSTSGTSNQVMVRMDKVPLTRAQAFLYSFRINVSAVIATSIFDQAPV